MNDQWWEPQPGDEAASTGSSTPAAGAAAPIGPRATSAPAPPVDSGGGAPSPTFRARSGANAMVIGVVAGLTAGLIGVGVGAAFTDSSEYAPGVIVGATAAALGFFLNGWERISAGYVGRGVARGALGALTTTLAGLGGLAIADGLFHAVDSGDQEAMRHSLIAGWLAIGVLVGAGVGALSGLEKLLSGLLGGALGGILGGVLFVALDGSRTVDRAMLVGVLAASTVLGAAIGLVERIRRQSWIQIIDGPLAGRQLILYRKTSTIGSGAGCDVALPGDPSLLAIHATLRLERGHVLLDGLHGPAMLDGAAFAGGAIPVGSVVGLGSTFFSVHTK